MAQETANITITLTDEVSAKLEEIAGKFEDLRRKMGDVGERGQKGFRDVRQEVERIGDSATGVNTALMSMSTFMRSALVEFTRNLAATQRGLSGFETGLAGVLTVGSRVAGAMTGLGSAIGGVATAAAAGAGGVYLIGRALSDSYQHAKNLRIELGQASDFMIRRGQAIGEALGMSAEQAGNMMQRMTRLMFDASRESNSQLFAILSRHGEAGMQMFRQIADAMKAGDNPLKIMDQFFDQLSTKSENFQRQVAEALNIPFSIIKQWPQMRREIRAPWEPTPEEFAALQKMQAELKKTTDAMKADIQDLIDEGWHLLSREAIPGVTAAIKEMQEALGPIIQTIREAMPGVLQAMTGEIRAVVRDIKATAEEIKAITEWWKANMPTVLGGTPEPKPEGQQEEPKTKLAPGVYWQRPGWSRSLENWLKNRNEQIQEQMRKEREGQPVQPMSFGGGGGGAALGGAPIILTKLTQEEERGNVYLREMRDVLVWLREQLGARQAGAGGGAPEVRRAAFRTGGGYEVLGQQWAGGAGGGGGAAPETDGGDRPRYAALPQFPGRPPPPGGPPGAGGAPPDGGPPGGGGMGALPGLGGDQGGVPRMPGVLAPPGMPGGRAGGIGSDYAALPPAAQPIGPGPGAPGGTAAIPGTSTAPGRAGAPGGNVRATWFSARGAIIPGWRDPSGFREGPQASGLPTTEPGIATPGRAGLGEWHKVTAPDGRVAYVRKSDIGPGRGPQARGVGADINAALAAQLYPEGPKTFQERGWGVERIGKALPEGIAPGIQAGAPAGVPLPQARPGGGGTTQAEPTVAPGASTTQEGGAVPSAMLDRARAVALGGGPGAVSRFMAAQGYPKSGAWCGQFAASVVSSVGGTPPRNPAVASNWRNWGEQVQTPQPGDIAVRGTSRFRGGGYVPTGQTGSHVTFVEDVDPRTGRFTGLGGNQGRWRSQYPTGQYQFFRAGQDRSFDVAGGRNQMLGRIQADINVRGPRGTRAKATAEGIMENPRVRLEQTPQMGSGGEFGGSEGNQYAEE